MWYRDIIFLDKDYNFIKGDICIENEIVVDIHKKNIVDRAERVVLPPFVDVHIHGGYGVDIMNSDSQQIEYLSKKLFEGGVGAYMPTTVAKSYDEILECAKRVKEASNNKKYAEILGIHIEGPFISKKYKGIMEENFIKPCDIRLYDSLKEIMGDLKIRFTIAPENTGAEEFCKYVVDKGDYISLGHSEASYEECNSIANVGASCYTHIFNAMSPLHHREVGIIGAGLLGNAFVEVICDFIHLDRKCVELVARLKEDKIILVTDAMEAMGINGGKYIFCGKEVMVENGAVRDCTGRLAGSGLTMEKAVSNMAEIVGLKSAVKMACENPSRLLNLHKFGNIDIGKRVII